MSTPTIGELIGVCEKMAAANRRLFEIVGLWVADEPDPEVQRWFSTAAHRHAWHAELWEARRPAVPLESLQPPVPPRPVEPAPGADRRSWYREQLDRLAGELSDLERRIDPLLDPSTARVVDLTMADIASLRR